MTLTDALAAALDGTWPTTDDPRGYGAPSWRYDFAAAILADPAFREALTVALAEQLERRELDCDPDGNIAHSTCDHDEQGAAIVAAMLP